MSMTEPARTIWDTRIQCCCGLVVAREGDDTELWMCGNYGQVSFSPPRIIVNPNRLYPIESMIRRTGRFSLNVLPDEERNAVLRLLRVRRRDPRKAERVGWRLEESDHGSPYLPSAIQSLFCEVEQVLETGDHTVMIARVAAVLENRVLRGRTPLLYRSVSGPRPSRSRIALAARDAAHRSGAVLAARKVLRRLRPPPPANLPEATYRDGGQTEREIEQVLSYGVSDRSRILESPPEFDQPDRPVAVCVVGTHWGNSHCEALRQASGRLRLFVCGRDEVRTRRIARAHRADGYFVGLEAALRDPRVEAVSLAMPHHLHRSAAEQALAAGKHVLVEKPIATTLADADSMIGAALRSGRVLMVAENMHYRPTLRAVSGRIAAGDLGEPLHMLAQAGAPRRPDSWMADREQSGGGVFMDIGIHYVRAMRLLVGEPDDVAAFRGMQVQTKIGGEDGLLAVFSSRYGWRCQILTTWAGCLGKTPDIVLIGDRGTFHLWPLTGYFDYYPVEPRLATRALGFVRPYRLQEKLARPELQRIRVRVGKPDTGYREEMKAFLTAICSGSAAIDSAVAGRRDLEIVLATYQALETCGTIYLC